MQPSNTSVAQAPEPWRVTYTPLFVLLCAYTFMILTFRAAGATVVMAVAVVFVILQRATLRAPLYWGIFVAWVGWAALVYTVNPVTNDVLWNALVEHAKLLLVVLVAVNALRTPTQIRYYLFFIVVSFMLFPGRSTLQNYVLGYTVFGRAVGPFIYSNSNDLAAISLLILGPAFATWSVKTARPLVRWIGLGAAAALMLIVVLTQSRGGFLGLAIVLLPTAMSAVRRRPRTVAAMAALLAAVLFAAPATFWQRIGNMGKGTSAETVGEMDPEGSAKQRFAIFQTGLRITADHAWLGVGLGGYPQANAEYSPSLGPRDTHNTYLNVAAETGIPGLLLWLALVGSVFLYARDTRLRARRSGARDSDLETLRWLTSALAGYMFAGVFGSYARLSITYIFITVVWVAAHAIRAQQELAEPARAPAVPAPAITPATAPIA